MHTALTPFDPVHTTEAGRRVLDAASRLFRDRGVGATGVDLVAQEAGTTKRTLYQRFGSKDALVAAYLQQRAHRWQHELLTALAPLADGDRAGAVDAVYAQARRWVQGPRGCAFVDAWAQTGPQDRAARAVVEAEKAWMRALFGHVAGDPARAQTLYLLYEGAQVAAAIGGGVDDLEAARRASRGVLAA